MNLPKKIKSIRFLLIALYTLLSLVALLVFGSTTYLYLEHLMDQTLDRNLVNEVKWISEIVKLEQEKANPKISPDSLSEEIADRISDHFVEKPSNYIVMLRTLKGNVLYESDNRAEDALLHQTILQDKTSLDILEMDGGEKLRVAVKRLDPYVIQVAYTQDVGKDVLNHLLSSFGLLVPIVILVSIVIGWIMANFILRPIRQVTELAHTITAHNLNERIPPRHVEDELEVLIQTMNEMIARLQKSFEQMRELMVNVAHEMRTPLTIMKGEAELALSKTLSPEEGQQVITTYLEETVRMSRLVEDLLTIAKAEAGQLILHKQNVELQTLIENLYEDALILSSNKKLNVMLLENQNVVVRGDPLRLQQLFRIVVNNAVHYTGAGGTIQISSMKEREKAVISIVDTGIGITAESLSKIFDRFYRSEEARLYHQGGSGLGLSIAKWIAEAHHGTINVESEVAQGSRFTIELPAMK